MRIRKLLRAFLLGFFLFPLVSRAQFLVWDFHSIITDERLSGAYPDMAVDANGKIHVSYWNQYEDRAMYAYRGPTDTAWTRQYIDATKPNGYRSAITIDANNRPHVVYLENQSNKVQVRYAFRDASGTWNIENVSGDPVTGWGEYGPNTSLNMSLRVKHSLDIVLNENQQPQVVFFDGRSELDAFNPCVNTSSYDLRMYQGIRDTSNTWTTRSFGIVPDVRNSCGPNSAGYSLPRGDRYGEYCQLLQRDDDKMQVFCLSRYNNRVLNFSNDSTGIDTVWTRGESDSLGRILPAWMWADRYFTIEGISAAQDPAGKMHLSYGTSLSYGENFFAGALGSNDMVYSRLIDDTTIFYHSFGTGAYRPYTNIATKGQDSIYIVYTDLSANQFLLQESRDAGMTWTLDTLWTGIGTYYSPTTVFQDSLVVVFYDDGVEKLLLGKRSLSGGEWRIEVINQSHNHGVSLDAHIHLVPTDTQFVTVFNDSYNGSLTFAEATTSNGINFSTSLVSEEPGVVSAVCLDRSTFGMNIIVYGGGENRQLKMAKGAPGNWGFEVIDSSGSVEYADMQISNLDTIHIAYYASDDSCLKYAKRHLFGSTWTFEDIDCDSLRTGQFPSLQLDSAGRPHIAYHSVVDKALMYARRDAQNQGWVIDSIHAGLSSAVGKYASLRLDQAGLPKIAYLDEQATALWLAEKSIGGQWTLSMVDSVPVTNLGRPIDMEIDSFGKVWIAYNHYTNFEKVKLMHRDSIWREVAVSTTGQIANAFAFRIVGGSLNLFGKKNALQNTGVAFLRSSNGVFVETAESIHIDEAMQAFAYPNPFSGQTTLELDVKSPLTVDVTIYDLYGRVLMRPAQGQKLGIGRHSVLVDGGNLPAGVYVYEISGVNGRSTGRLVKTP